MQKLVLDDNEQPPPAFNFAKRLDRGIHEMLGICKGVIADGTVNAQEARYLHDWMEANPELSSSRPVDILARRLYRIFGDGRVDEQERADLAELLAEISGGSTNVIVGEKTTSTLPLDQPPPAVEFGRKVFVFTGKFAMGPRTVCEDITCQRGAYCESRITKRTDYVIIGSFGSRDWAHTSFGRKIMKAVEMRDEAGIPLRIVSEDHWAASLH